MQFYFFYAIYKKKNLQDKKSVRCCALLVNFIAGFKIFQILKPDTCASIRKINL